MAFSLVPKLDLSIIIVSYNVRDLLKRCLNSIFDFQKELSFEVTVIDNHSEDESTQMLKRDFPGINLIENHQNLGFSAACNQGMRQSRGRYFFLLNPDTELTSAGINGMIRFMDSHLEVGICGPRMVDSDGDIQFSARSFPSYLTAISSRQSLLNRLFPDNPWSCKYLLKDLNRNQVEEVDWVSGSALLTRREVVEKIGFLDERFFMYVEDVDFCYRAKQAGFSIRYFPQCLVIHHHGKSTRRRKSRMLTEHHRSMYLFYKKHHHPTFLLAAMVFFGIWIRLGLCLWANALAKRV
jgi:GT2 family glycosyltransferase